MAFHQSGWACTAQMLTSFDFDEKINRIIYKSFKYFNVQYAIKYSTETYLKLTHAF